MAPHGRAIKVGPIGDKIYEEARKKSLSNENKRLSARNEELSKDIDNNRNEKEKIEQDMKNIRVSFRGKAKELAL